MWVGGWYSSTVAATGSLLFPACCPRRCLFFFRLLFFGVVRLSLRSFPPRSLFCSPPAVGPVLLGPVLAPTPDGRDACCCCRGGGWDGGGGGRFPSDREVVGWVLACFRSFLERRRLVRRVVGGGSRPPPKVGAVSSVLGPVLGGGACSRCCRNNCTNRSGVGVVEEVEGVEGSSKEVYMSFKRGCWAQGCIFFCSCLDVYFSCRGVTLALWSDVLVLRDEC